MSNLYRRSHTFYYDEGDDVTVYPVPADEISAYLAGGSSGTTVRGMFIEDDELVDFGDGIPVEDHVIKFETYETRADAVGLAAKTHSIEFQSKKYDVLNRRFKDPVFTEARLQEYTG